MSSPKTHYSCAELAALKLPGYPASDRRMRDLAEREGWLFREVKGKGGKGGLRREYQPPKGVRDLIGQQQKADDKHAAIAAEGATAKALLAEIQAERNAKTAQAQEKSRKAREVLEKIAGAKKQALVEEELDVSVEVVTAYKAWFAEHRGLRRSVSWAIFAEAYNRGQIAVSEAAKALLPTTSGRTVQRWVLKDEKEGKAALVDKRRLPAKTRGVNAITQQPLLRDAVVALLVEKPHAATMQIRDVIRHLAVDKESGEILFEVPPLDTFYDFRKTWEAENAQVHLAATNPDAWKNKFMSAAGDADYDVTGLNERWEMDATPCDWELADGRYSMSVVVDIWSRRLCVVLAKTATTAANKLCLRKAIKAWGKPRRVRTDNGKDYTSAEIELALQALDIQHEICAPFSPWQKGFVERHIQTLLHSCLEFLDAFIGHNVAERQALRARQTFAEQLFKKGTAVKVDLTAEELQRLLDAWIAGTYEQREHKGIGMTPFEKAASWTGTVSRVENERALDVLLWKPKSPRPYTIQKKGVRLNKAWYNAAEFGGREGEQVIPFQDPSDLGRVVVYDAKMKFLAVAEAHELTGVNPMEVAAHRRNRQTEAVNAEKQRLKKLAKDTLGSVQDVVRDLLNTRAEAAGKLTRLPTTDVAAQSHGLSEAARAAEAMDRPPRSPEAEKLIAEAKALRPRAPVIEIPVQAVHPLDRMDDAERYDYWHELDATVKSDGELPDDARIRLFYADFPRSARFKAQAAIRQQNGPQALQR